jgi:hypothetical protein
MTKLVSPAEKRRPLFAAPTADQEASGPVIQTGASMPDERPSPSRRFLDPPSLVARWEGAVNVGTLAKWRMRGCGPRFLKLGSKVLYPLDEVVAYETANLRAAAE